MARRMVALHTTNECDMFNKTKRDLFANRGRTAGNDSWRMALVQQSAIRGG